MEREYRAKLFTNGGSQAVRLPKECRFPGTEVRVRKRGSAVIIEPVENARPGWPEGFWESMRPVSEDFDVPEPLPPTPHRDEVLEELNERAAEHDMRDRA
jgi:antitoxin VapB